MEAPRAAATAQAELAVDCLARLCCGLDDGEAPEPEDAALLAAVVAGGLCDEPGMGEEAAAAAVATRGQRASAYN